MKGYIRKGEGTMSIPEQKSQKVRENGAKLPLRFIPNKGQLQQEVHFYGRRSGCGFYFTREEAMFVFRGPFHANGHESKTTTDTDPTTMEIALSLRFIESNSKVKMEGQKEGTGKVHFLTGNDPAKWVTNLLCFHEIIYRELWPGVDLIFQEGMDQLKYLLIVQPGANISSIRMTYRGADDLSLDEEGNLRIHISSGVFIDERPVSFQEMDGKQVPVTSFFVIEEDEHEKKKFGFEVGEDYDPRYPLLIDPGLVYSTYLGASLLDQATRIAVDSLGQAIVTGFTGSPNFPPSPITPPQPIYGGGVSDAFVAKLNADGSDLVFFTFLGGTGEDRGLGVTLDDGDNIHVSGLTSSTNFPVTADTAYQPTYQGGANDGFYTKLSADGSTLLYSTYFGGTGNDRSAGVAVDNLGLAWLTGQTNSTDFPITLPNGTGPIQTVYQGGANDAFVAKINPTLSGATSLVYSTYLGGSGDDRAMDVAVDPDGNFYATGVTNSPNFPPHPIVPPNPMQPAYGGGLSDAFVIKFAENTDVVYSTFLGGSGMDEGRGIAVDTSGRAYVTGRTNSLNFPGTPLSPIHPPSPIFPPVPWRTFQGGTSDAFIAIINPAGTVLDFAAYLGGSGEDVGTGITVNPFVYVTGFTRSPDFPVTPGAVQTTYQGGPADAFVTKFDPTVLTIDAIVYSTFLGGSGDDEALGIALDAAKNGYVTGFTNSLNFPTTPNAFQQTYQGGPFDGFVSKLDFLPVPPLTIACSPDITVMNDLGVNGAVVHFSPPTASGGIPGITIACSPPSGSFFHPGNTLVTCTATDAVGNTSACSFNVKVIVDPCRFFSGRCRRRD